MSDYVLCLPVEVGEFNEEGVRDQTTATSESEWSYEVFSGQYIYAYHSWNLFFYSGLTGQTAGRTAVRILFTLKKKWKKNTTDPVGPVRPE